MKSPEINPTLTWDKFADVFGRDSLALISFNNLVDRNLDPFQHFMKTVLQCTITAAPENVVLNTSMNKFDIEILRAINYLYYREEGKTDKSTRNLYLKARDKSIHSRLYRISNAMWPLSHSTTAPPCFNLPWMP